tara:strand:- start:199 stop:531 length:333 start_codon:yes stop_codon:yes gene_type:complete
MSAHDISLGGIMVAIAKMCIKGNKGIEIKKTNQLINEFQYMFSEDQGRYIVEIEKENYKEVKEILDKSSVYYDELGLVLDKDIVFDDKSKISIDELSKSNNTWLKDYMDN